MFKTALVFLVVSLFCILLNYVYSRYSHGVYSNYMTYMFAYPLIGGVVVNLLAGTILKTRVPGRFAINIYNSGIATLTVGSMLRGIFDIAGTSSPYQPVFVVMGWLMLLAGVVYYIAEQFKKP